MSIAVIMAWGLRKCLASLCGRLQKLSSSSATFFRAAIFLRHQLFDKLRQLATAVSLLIDLSDALEALLEFDD
jgi:hypothetical protein